MNKRGDVVNRYLRIQQENRQRAKHLTNATQIHERRLALHQIKLNRFHKLNALFNAEKKKYEENDACERKIMVLYTRYTNSVHTESNTISHQHTFPSQMKCGLEASTRTTWLHSL